MEQKNPSLILREQHKNLVEMVTKIKEQAAQDTPSAEEILKELGVFKEALLGHLEIESKEFYPQLLEKLSQSGKDVDKTKEFVGKMEGIANQVVAFFETYNNTQKIDDNIEHFRKNLEKIIDILSIRIEAEEDFVFTDWEYLVM